MLLSSPPLVPIPNVRYLLYDLKSKSLLAQGDSFTEISCIIKEILSYDNFLSTCFSIESTGRSNTFSNQHITLHSILNDSLEVKALDCN